MVVADPKQEFSDRLNRALDRIGVPPKGKGRQVELAKMFSVSQKGARKWLEGESIPDTKRLPEMTARLNVNGEWLLTGHGPMGPLAAPSRQSTANTSSGPEVRELPLISWVQAGAWAEVVDPYEPGGYERLVPVTRRYSDRAYALRVEGDSMQAPDGPSFPPGSIIIVEPGAAARNGSFVVARLEATAEATFKQLVIDGGRKYLKPLNPRYPMLPIDSDATICGVVRQMVMDFE